MLNCKFYMIVISIDWSFIWYNISAYLYNIKTMVKHFLNIPIFQWRRVTSQFKENAQNNCLSIPAPNAFYGDSAHYSWESVKIYFSHFSDKCPLLSVCTCLWKCVFFVLKVTQIKKVKTLSAVLISRWFLKNELVEYMIYMDLISVQIPIFCTPLINWIHYQFHWKPALLVSVVFCQWQISMWKVFLPTKHFVISLCPHTDHLKRTT